MKPGQRVAGRWELVRELAGGEDWARWEVRDGERVGELVAPKPHALLRPGARERFFGSPLPDDPAALPRYAEDEVDGVPVRIQARTRSTFADVRLADDEALAVAGWLGPAVLGAGGVCAGELTLEDLVVDAEGVPRLAPLGIPRGESVARKPVHRAPEGPGDGRSDLYGLGVALWHAVTGATPRLPPPPLDPRLDPLFAGLLSLDPDARAAALPPAPDAPPVLTAPAVPPAPVSPAPLVPAGETPRYVVVVPLRGLAPAARRKLAVRAAADPAAVERAAARGAQWAVAGVASEVDAAPVTRRLAAAGLPARVQTTVAPRAVHYWVLAAVVGIVGLVSGLWLPLGVAAAVLTWMGLVNFRHMFPVAEARLAWQEQARHPADPASVAARLAALRARVERAELHDAVTADLRARIADCERRLDAAIDADAPLDPVGDAVDAIGRDLDAAE